MKKGAKPELTQKWWSKNKAMTLGKTGFGKALKSFEKAKAKKNPVAIATAIREIEPVLKKAISKCDKKKHAETLTALTKYPNLLVKEREIVIKLIDAWATKGVVVNLHPGNGIIDKAVDDIYKKRGLQEDAALLSPGEAGPVGKHSKKTDEDNADFSKMNDSPIVLLAHGTPSFGTVPSGAQQTATKFANKKPADIVKFLTKSLDKSYAGMIYLDGCYTAAGNSPMNFAKKVYDDLLKSGYIYLQVKGNLGVACTTDSGKELVSHAQIDNYRKKLKKDTDKADEAYEKLKDEIESSDAPDPRKEVILGKLLTKLNEMIAEEDGLYIEALTGTFGPKKKRPKL